MIFRRLLLGAVLLSAMTFFTGNAAEAQVPGALVPGRQEERNIPPLPNRPLTPVLPGANIQVAPENSEEITFELNSLVLDGAKAIPETQLQHIWRDKLGTTISVAVLYDIANAITKAYVDAGYALSFAFVPEQEIDEGHVTLRVVEGFVDEIVFAGEALEDLNDWPDGGKARGRLDNLARHIRQSRPLRTEDLERYLLLMNERPGLRVQATFVASQKTPQASTLIINTAFRPIEISLSTDNRMAPSLGHWSIGATGTANGVLTGADQLRISARCGIFCEVYNSQSLSWTTYVGGRGAMVGVSASSSSEKPKEGILVPLDFRGEDTQLSLQASYPLIRTRQTSFDVGGSLNWSNSETTIFTGTLTEDRIRTVAGYGSISHADSLGAFNLLRLDVTQGLPVLGQTEDNDINKSRAGGKAVFTTAKLAAVRNQPLGTFAPSLSAYSLYMSAQVQSALFSPLLSVSQCFYGGGDIGRGYDSGAISGDSCAMAIVEMRRDFAVRNVAAQAYVFGDAGTVWRRGDLGVGEKSTSSAQSLGLGLRVMTAQNMQADIQVSKPLHEKYASNGKDSARLFFSLSWQY